MRFKVPKKFTVGSVDYDVNLVDHCGENDDFGLWRSIGTIDISTQADGDETSESKRCQTFLHEMTHSILFAMGQNDLNTDESFVNTFSSFLYEAISTME